MGIRGLSSYIHEHMHEVLVRHKLHGRKVVIDGNNLAHVLYFECTGINAAFGGDYDKYASFVEEFFTGLKECDVQPVVVMDGGQPLDNKKMNTVRERVTNQIQTCLHISPSSQYRLKVFPSMGRDVFVSTLRKLGITVLQTDFEADLEIAMLARELGMAVLSNDSDFYMFDVPLVLLSSITYNKVSVGKKRRSNEVFKYISCCHFNQEKFCQITGIDAGHFPLLATLLGNDYLPFDHFKEFYNSLDSETKKSRMTSRHNTIKNVLAWLARQRGKNAEEIIAIVARHCTTRNLRCKMRATMRNYSHGHTNLINLVSQNFLRYEHDTKTGCNFNLVNSKKEDRFFQNPDLTKMSNFETSLFCKNGKTLPQWFVSAYRAHRIPHEVADIVTQQYFISPPQVEDKSSTSAYLLVEPIVRVIYSMLWKSSELQYGDQMPLWNYDNVSLGERSLGNYAFEESSVSQSDQVYNTDRWSEGEMCDSDVIVEDDSEEFYDESECMTKQTHFLSKQTPENVVKSLETKTDSYPCSKMYDSDVDESEEMEESKCTTEQRLSLNKETPENKTNQFDMNSNQCDTNTKCETNTDHCERNIDHCDTNTDHFDTNTDQCETNIYQCETNTDHYDTNIGQFEKKDMNQCRKQSLKWYLRKGTKLWIKKVPQLPPEQANNLPSLNEVEFLSITEKKKVFYSVLKTNLQSGIPADLELILGFIVFWFEESASSLLDIHALSVLVCVFMFYIIDGKVGRIRTRKAFEEEEKWKARFCVLKSDPSYCCSGAGVEELLSQMSREECLLAGHRLFRFHHMNEINDKHFNRKTVHVFSEYQACIYFIQLLNALLDSPFPLLSIENLWGGTFCYNIFYDLKRRKNPLARITEILGKGSCIERLFFMLFRQLSETLNFTKYLTVMDAGNIALESGKKFEIEPVRTQKKKKRRRRGVRPSKTSNHSKEDSTREEIDQEDEPKMSLNITEEEEENVDLLDNRFAGLLLET